MKKRVIKLINNERKNTKLVSSKACDITSTDICKYEDHAECTVHSYDSCDKDYAGCFRYASDYCSGIYDVKACYGVGEIDRI